MPRVPNDRFFEGVRTHFDFLTGEFGFSFEAEEISDRFNVPSITYRRGDIWIQITRGRGSLKVFIGYYNKINTSGTYGELLYFMDYGRLPTERVTGYGPKPDWELDSSSRLVAQMNWYRNHLRKHLQSAVGLFLDPERRDEFHRLAELKREQRQAL